MYNSIIQVLDFLIREHVDGKLGSGMSEKEKHYFLQGLEVAKQQIEQLEDIHSNDLAHDTLEEVLKGVKNTLDFDQVNELVKEIFNEK